VFAPAAKADGQQACSVPRESLETATSTILHHNTILKKNQEIKINEHVEIKE
jgi:hypothetical protein